MSKRLFVAMAAVMLAFAGCTGSGSAGSGAAQTGSVVTIADAASIIGSYSVDGTNPDGSKYFGTVDLKPGDAGKVDVSWVIGSSTWAGTGEVTSEGKLLVTYGGTFSGDGTWSMMSDGKLHGDWQATGTSQAGKEVWTKQ